MPTYLNYVVSTQPLKGVPAFDSQIEGINQGSGENEEFGDWTGTSVNFTDYTAQKNNTSVTDEVRRNVRLLNPMSFLDDGRTTVAKHWYIRHGARDRDTAFPIPLNFAIKLQKRRQGCGFSVGMESSAQWRLCARRTIPMDSENRGSIVRDITVPPDRSFHYPLLPCCYHHPRFHATDYLCSFMVLTAKPD